MAVKITFESHSTTFDNEAKRASGWNDIALSSTGLEQAVAMGKRNAEKDFSVIFCSDLKRSYKAAEIAFSDKNISIIRDKRLRECDYGDLTQHPMDEVNAQKLQRVDVPFPNGESYMDVLRRMKDFLDDLRQNYDGKHVLIVGHRATQYGLDHFILGLPMVQIVTTPFKWQPGTEYELR